MTAAEHNHTKDNKQYEFDVALSFAEEDRAFVDKVARHLKRKNVKIFYDKDAMIDTWGKNMYTHLNDIYKNKARYCVMFISKYYKKKRWTQHERDSAQARAFFLENGEYILPFRFDDTEIEGIRDTIGYLQINDFDEKGLADAIIAKLHLSDDKPVPPLYVVRKIGLSPLEKAGRILRSRIKALLLVAATAIVVVLGFNNVLMPADTFQGGAQEVGGATKEKEQKSSIATEDVEPKSIGAIRNEGQKSNTATKDKKQKNSGTVIHGAVCEDGWLSTSRGSGTCSHHGGVKYYIDTVVEEAKLQPLHNKK